jgi:hypothetical protein
LPLTLALKSCDLQPVDGGKKDKNNDNFFWKNSNNEENQA